MALQTKTISSSTTSNEYTLKLELTENSVNENDNTSNISYRLYMTSGDWDFDIYSVGWEVKLNGQVVDAEDRENAPQISLPSYSSVNIVSGTVNIKHNSNGQLNMSVSARSYMVQDSWTPGNMSLSGSMPLTPITIVTNKKSEIQLVEFDGIEDGIAIYWDSYSDTNSHHLNVRAGTMNYIPTTDEVYSGQKFTFSPAQIGYFYQQGVNPQSCTITLTTYGDTSRATNLGEDQITIYFRWVGTVMIRTEDGYKRARPWVNRNGSWYPAIGYYRTPDGWVTFGNIDY